jgi:hypothetical protein
MRVKAKILRFVKGSEMNSPLHSKHHIMKANTEHKSCKNSVYRRFVGFTNRAKHPLGEASCFPLLGAECTLQTIRKPEENLK